MILLPKIESENRLAIVLVFAGYGSFRRLKKVLTMPVWWLRKLLLTLVFASVTDQSLQLGVGK